MFEYFKKTKFDLALFYSTIIAIVIIRTILENFVESEMIISKLSFYFLFADFIHIFISWGSLFLWIVIILYFFSKDSFENVVKIGLYGFLLILIVPLLDGFIFGKGVISYNYDFSNFFYSYINLFNPKADIDFVTNGVRVEIFIVLLVSFLYLKEFSIIKAILGVVLIYSIIFIYGYLPAFYGNFNLIFQHSILIPKNIVIWNLYVYIPIILALFLYFFIVFKDIFISFMRMERLIIYIGLLLFGVFYSLKNSLLIEYNLANIFDIFKIIMAIISLSFIFFYSVIINDINDIQIDKISNSNRVLPKKLIKLKTYRELGNIFLSLGLFLGFSVNLTFFFILIFIWALSFLYSSKPIRLKQYLLISNLILAIIGFSVFLLGVSLLEERDIIKMAKPIFIFVFGAFFIASFLKDYKDKISDEKYGIITIANKFENSFIFVKILIIIFYIYMTYSLLGVNLYLFLLISLIFIFRDSEKLLLYIQFIVSLIYITYIFL